MSDLDDIFLPGIAIANASHLVSKQTTSPKSPLELPEILDVVASHLDKNDLVCCLCVSKSWRDAFLPHRWRTVHISYEAVDDLFKYFGPDSKVLDKHRTLVRELSIRGPFDEDENTWESIDDCLSLTQGEMEQHFCEMLSMHNNIRSLHLKDMSIQADVVPTFWEACKNLDSLGMWNTWIEGEFIPVPESVVFNRLRRLDMDRGAWTGWRALDLVAHCPKLESFPLDGKAFSSRILVNRPIRVDCWPDAQALLLARNPGDTELASIFEGIGNCCGSITHFELSYCSLGPQAIRALGFHFGSLVDLRLGSQTSVNSAAILEVLCSCPMLESLKAGRIRARDIAERGPWVCQQLLQLQICFGFGDTELHLQRLVFERLSALVRLKFLDMRRPADWHDRVLDFRLEYGLGQLESLQDLLVLQFSDGMVIKQTQRLGMEDIEWMVRNWKKLKDITGKLNRDQEINYQLKSVLKSHGIATV
ncbi:hypothetical protein BGX34_003587 [Mortierella sp. NVP85]|nr:hypothetical protein BGX34_003587 [Mortierella sp. NVP85]